MRISLMVLIVMWMSAFGTARVADPADILHGAAHVDQGTSHPRNRFRHVASDRRVPLTAAIPPFFSERRLFGIRDLWSWLGGKNREELLHEAQEKLTDMRTKVNNSDHRQLQKYELGTMFHTLRFFANRIGDVNDKAYTAQENNTATMQSMSSSSSKALDAEAEKAVTIQQLREKAAEAYGLKTTAVETTATPSSTPMETASPTPTKTSLFSGMEW